MPRSCYYKETCYYKEKRQPKPRIPFKIMSSGVLMPADYASDTIPPALPDLFSVSLGDEWLENGQNRDQDFP